MAPDASWPAGLGSRLRTSDESIDEASDESFPASDPPSTWSGGDLTDDDEGPAEQ
jgi:hypothetical protein